MSISATVRHYLDHSGTSYELVRHSRAFTSMETAQAAHVAGERLVKSVVVKEGDGHHYAIVALPSTHRVQLPSLCEQLGRSYELASEQEIRKLLPDCDVGSVPPFGQAYGIEVLLDDALLQIDDVYAEGGDHEELVHLSGDDFRKLMSQARHGRFG